LLTEVGAHKHLTKSTIGIRELQEALSAGTIALDISSRNARVAALQELGPAARRDRPAPPPGTSPCAGPGGSTGLLIRDDKGEDADRLVYGVDTASSLHCALARRFGPVYEKRTYPANRDARATII